MLYTPAISSSTILNTRLMEAILSTNLKEIESVLNEIYRLTEQERHIALNSPYKPGKTHKEFEKFEGQTPMTALFCGKKLLPHSDDPYNFTQHTFELLLAAGADPNQRNKGGYAPIHFAAYNADESNNEDFRLALLCQLPAVREVLTGSEPFLTYTKPGKTALQLCVESKKMNPTRYLIKEGLCENELLTPYMQDSTEKQMISLLEDNYLFPNSGKSRCYFESPDIEGKRLSKRNGGKQPVMLKRNVIHDFEFSPCLKKIVEEKNKEVYREPIDKNYEAINDIVSDPRAFYAKFPDRETRVKALEEMLNLPKEQMDGLILLLDKKHDFTQRCEHEFERLHDIRSAKMLGHRVGLTSKYNYEEEGSEHVQIYSYEWFSSYPTFVEMTQNIVNFNECIASQPNQYSTQEVALLKEVEETYRALDMAFDDDSYLALANRYLEGKPVLLPSKTEDHTAVMVLYKNKLYTVDKGNYFNNGIRCYEIDETSLQHLKKQHEVAKFLKHASEAERKKNSGVLDLDSLKALQPKFVYNIELQGQKQCNCSYTNPKRGCEAIMLALSDDQTSPYAGMNRDRIRSIYKDFSLYERKKGIEEYINQHIDSLNVNKWDPLFDYLKSKASSNHPHSVELSKFIVEKLKAPPISLSEQQILEGTQRQPKPDTFHVLATTFRRVQSSETGRLMNKGAKNREALEMVGLSPSSSPFSSPSIKRKLGRSSLRSSISMVDPPSFESNIEAELSTLAKATQVLRLQMDAKPFDPKKLEAAVLALNHEVGAVQKLLESGIIIKAGQFPLAKEAITTARVQIQDANVLIQKHTQSIKAPSPIVEDMDAVLRDLLTDSEESQSPRHDETFGMGRENPLLLCSFTRQRSHRELTSSDEIELDSDQKEKNKKTM